LGLRGKGARIPTKRKPKAEAWDAPGLTPAERVILFVESLTITSGAHAGRKFILRPWQKAIVEAWYATDTEGKRIVRTGLLTLGRKNGKTSLCAALALAHLVGPMTERRGQVVAAASDRDQAALIFDEIAAFILDNPAFARRTNVQRFAKIIEDLPSGTKFSALSSDYKKAHGLSPSVVIVDELAQWGHTQKGRELFTALTTATGARESPLALIISTQTPDEQSLMSELVAYGKEVNSGLIRDEDFSAHVFEVPLDSDPWDEALWGLANPALGDFRSLEEMQSFAERAKRMPAQAAAFRAYYLNQPIRTDQHWLDVEEWSNCAVLSDPPAAGRKCYGGLDLASKSDLTALALWFPNDDGSWDLYFDVWAPQAKIDERAGDRVPYPQWVEDGWLHATPGNTTDNARVEQRIYEVAKTYQLVELGVDPWNARDLTVRLNQNNVNAVEIQQNMATLTTPSKAFESLILQRKIRHEGSPLVRWCVGNAIAVIDANENIRPDKRRSGDKKIDPVSAAITGLARAMILESTAPSVYESRGVVML
jgi:phage terminase large subunit-like protein